MHYWVALFSLAFLINEGNSRPVYKEYHGSDAPLGFAGPIPRTTFHKDSSITETSEISAPNHKAAFDEAHTAAEPQGYYRSDESIDSGTEYGEASPGNGGGHNAYASGGSNGFAEQARAGHHRPFTKLLLFKPNNLAESLKAPASKHYYEILQKANLNADKPGYSGSHKSHDSGAGYRAAYNLYGSSGFGTSYESDTKHDPVGYHEPLIKVVVLKSGYLASTPEVSAAKHSHYAALEKASAAAAAQSYEGDARSYSSGGGYGSSYSSGDGYGGSHSSSGSGSGYAGSYSSVGSGSGYGGSYSSRVGYGNSYSSVGSDSGYAGFYSSSKSGLRSTGSYKYSGPLAYPKVLPSGLLADTHEVEAARHAHLNALAVTASEHAQKWANNYNH